MRGKSHGSSGGGGGVGVAGVGLTAVIVTFGQGDCGF